MPSVVCDPRNRINGASSKTADNKERTHLGEMRDCEQGVVVLNNDLSSLVWPHDCVGQQCFATKLVPKSICDIRACASQTHIRQANTQQHTISLQEGLRTHTRTCAPSHAMNEMETAQTVAMFHFLQPFVTVVTRCGQRRHVGASTHR